MTKARELAELSRTIIDTSDATAITINADEEVTLADDLFLADGKKAIFGAGSDLQIYHDGGNSYIAESGDGDLIITTSVLRPRTDQFTLNNAANSEHLLTAAEGGSVALYYDAVKKLETDSSGVSISGVLTVIDGSTSAPSISNAGDSNSGIYFPADDQLGLLVGGSRKLHVTSSGVDIENGSLTAGAATFSGNVFSGNKTGLSDTNTGHAIAPGGLVYHTTDGTLTQSLNRLTDDGPVLRLVGNNTTAGSIGVLSGGLSFGTGTSLTTRMVINSGGNVGIGTGTSTIAFSAGNGLRVENASTATLRLQDTGSHGFELRAHADAAQFYTANNKPYIFYDSSNNELLHIASSGNVGIADPAPSEKLNVAGNIMLEGGDQYVYLTNAGTGNSGIYVRGNTASSYLRSHSTGKFTWEVTGSQKMELDANGRLGVGISPEFSSTFASVELGTTSLISPSNTNGRLVTNLYYDGAYKRKHTGASLQYEQDSAGHIWYYDSSASADTGFTQTEMMRLDSSGNLNLHLGNLGVGSTNAQTKVHILGTSDDQLTIDSNSATANSGLFFREAGNSRWELYHQGTTGDFRFYNYNTSSFNFAITENGNWIAPHEDTVQRSFVGLGPFNVFDFSSTWEADHSPSSSSMENTTSDSLTNPMGVNMSFPTNVTSRVFKYDRTPTGTVGVIMEAKPDSNSTWNGGWNSGAFRVDPEKGYVMGFYVKRVGSASGGTFYTGFSHGIAAGTGTNVDSNPYFSAISVASMAQDVWCLAYFHLHPRYYTGTGDGGYGGLYRMDTGERTNGHTAWKQPTNQNYQVFRTYVYYSANPAVCVQWYAPFVYEINGHEPTVASLMAKVIPDT